MYLVSLQGQGTSCVTAPVSSTSGAPTLCTAGTKGAPASISASTSLPTRVMTPMLTTT